MYFFFYITSEKYSLTLASLHTHTHEYRRRENLVEEAVVKRVVMTKYRALGPITFREGVVLLFFFVLVFLWVLRAPEFIDGWSMYFYETYGV